MGVNGTDAEICGELRREIFLTGYRGGAAHLASCFSSVEILYTLYMKGVLRLGQSYGKNEGEPQDHFVLSKGHAALALYAVLHKSGLITDEELHGYLGPNGRLGGEPRRGELRGVEAATGSLGHGLPMATGLAAAQKMDGSPFRTYVLLGDGECEEGSVWEAAAMAASFSLDNLVAVMDCNGLQKTGAVADIMQGVRWKERWEACGWTVRETDGHNPEGLRECLLREAEPGKPVIIIARTVKGKGVSLMEGNPQWHYRLPSRKELRIFKEELQIADGEAD